MSSYYPATYDGIAAHAPADARALFIRRTYAHLAGAVLALIGLEAMFFQVEPLRQAIHAVTMGTHPLIFMVMFIGATMLARYWAYSDQAPALQYAGLGIYVSAYAVIMFPLLEFAQRYHPGAITSAAILAGGVFVGLTMTVMVTKRDFTNIGPILMVGGWVSVGFLVVCAIFGFEVPLLFMYLMVALMSGYIMYYTSAIMYQFRTDQHVAAALALFASVMTLFMYILEITMSRRD